MGQTQSEEAAPEQSSSVAPQNSQLSSTSMDSLIAGPTYLIFGGGEIRAISRLCDKGFIVLNNSLFRNENEAVAYGNDENESLEAKAQKALECPCIADLRNGQCGFQFSEAFLCFIKSTAEEKGSDCVHPFVALQKCIKDNPNAFSENILEENEVKKEEEPTQEYKIIPPLWSTEPQSQKKSKL